MREVKGRAGERTEVPSPGVRPAERGEVGLGVKPPPQHLRPQSWPHLQVAGVQTGRCNGLSKPTKRGEAAGCAARLRGTEAAARPVLGTGRGASAFLPGSGGPRAPGGLAAAPPPVPPGPAGAGPECTAAAKFSDAPGALGSAPARSLPSRGRRAGLPWPGPCPPSAPCGGGAERRDQAAPAGFRSPARAGSALAPAHDGASLGAGCGVSVGITPSALRAVVRDGCAAQRNPPPPSQRGRLVARREVG